LTIYTRESFLKYTLLGGYANLPNIDDELVAIAQLNHPGCRRLAVAAV
jgi:hypothetical protein